ncbi:Spc98 family-domain-containing protein, partial [Mycena galopus ATCC 62051]
VLPEFTPRFFVPPMLEKPQNPIMDTLKLRDPIAPVPTPLRPALPTELVPLTPLAHGVPKLNDSIWTDAIKAGFAHSEILSWDALRPNYSGHSVPNAFISEQDNLVFAAARYYVRPRLNDSNIEVKYVTQHELLAALKMTVLGTSSPLHTWDPVSETFVQTVAQKGTRGILLVDDKDEVVSKSWISGFITIGTLMRRLEILLTSLGSRFVKEGPTIHAFTHALSTILSFLRESLAECPPREDQVSITLSAVWTECERYKDILVSLAALCGRDEHKPPRDYVMLDHTPIHLLSHLYDHLHTHMEHQSPTMVTAVFAFMLTSVSREYFQQLSRSVGFGGDSSVKKPARVVGEQNDHIIDSFPTFFPPNVVNVLPAAQKSLILLRAAEPDHPLLRVPPVQCVIEAAWDRRDHTPVSKQTLEDSPIDREEPGLAQFRIFDLEPGGHFGHSLLDDKRTPTPVSTLESFIAAFPMSLHPITPTLSHLTSLVFEQLVQHASTLSSALLSLFLSPAAPLQFRPHMELLHSYLLLAAPSFKSRLAAALFSDSQGYDADELIPRSKRDRAHRWPVGLSLALFERETWPPVGADLSFFLRTVIVDSFEMPAAERDLPSPSTRETFWVEAERRLGFAIRDLPTGPGHDQWLNPLSLDFLYMDYKAPHPLDILITPEILSIEHALAAVFRMCRTAARPLFPTLAPSNKLLLHLRFIAHSFMTHLSEYVLDTAIGGNFDPSSQPAFSDVFALAKAHSALMDDVLSACLLRSHQRAAGDLCARRSNSCSSLPCWLGISRRDGWKSTKRPALENLAGRFRAKMAAVTKALKALLDKEPLAGGSELSISSQGQGRRPQALMDSTTDLPRPLEENCTRPENVEEIPKMLAEQATAK